MLRFDQRLTQIFLEARNQARVNRKVNGVSTIDLFTELIEDSESLLYAYLIEMNPYEEIATRLLELNENYNEVKDLEYPISVTLIITADDGKKKEKQDILVTEQLYTYIKAAEKLAKSVKEKEIIAQDLLTVIIQNPIKPIIEFLRILNADIIELREELEYAYYESSEEKIAEQTLGIPEEMRSYLSIFSGEDTILGRDKEIESAWNILLKKTKRNVILVGEPGVGKTAIVKKMISQIKSGTAPEEFKNFIIYSLDTTAIISGTQYRGDSEKRFIKLISFMKQQKNAILFIDEVHLVIGAGRGENTNLDLSNALKPLLAGDEARVIAATTTKEYKEYFSKDPAIKRRFEKVIVDEPTTYEVYPMIKAKIDELSEFHKVKITRQMVDFIALYAACFSSETKNPDRTIDLIDRSMVAAKRRKRSTVNRESVLSNFKVNMDFFKSIPEENKRATAYHEAGHYIAFSFLPYLQKTVKPVVVSIYPAENYMGATVTEKKKNAVELRDKQAYLEHIAAYLAGGIAEALVNTESNDGISADSKYATQLAKTLVTETGFYKNFFYTLDVLETERSVEADVKEIKMILAKAKKIAEEVIEKHRSELDAVVNALMKKHVVSDEDLKKIMKKAMVPKEERELVLT